MKIKRYFTGYLFLFVTLYSIVSVAQTTTIKVNKEADVTTFFNESRWLLPSFESATLFLIKNRSSAEINFDLLTEKLFFIDAKKDTLALQNIQDVVIVQVGQRLFKFHNNAFVEVMYHSTDNEIWLRRQIRKTDIQKTGAYGLPSATSAVTNLNSVNVGGHFKDLDVVEWVKYKQLVTFYLSRDSKVRTANKAGFLKSYPKKKKQVEKYLDEQPVNFENIDDLIRLSEFCNEE